jgi:hypothetical protein
LIYQLLASAQQNYPARHQVFYIRTLNVDLMKLPKAEDVILDALAILSMIFMLSGLIRLVSNLSYGLPLFSIGLVLLIVFIVVVAALRKNRQPVQLVHN